jgi:hypothetical protein
MILRVKIAERNVFCSRALPSRTTGDLLCWAIDGQPGIEGLLDGLLCMTDYKEC